MLLYRNINKIVSYASPTLLRSDLVFNQMVFHACNCWLHVDFVARSGTMCHTVTLETDFVTAGDK